MEKIEDSTLIADDVVTGIESDLVGVEPTPPQAPAFVLEVQNGEIGATTERI